MLEGKNAIIYGGGGSIGGAVARAFAREGATVHLAGRTESSLAQVAAEITAEGGHARTAIVDALDEGAVDAHADAVVAEAGSIDISFNLISQGDVQGTPLAEMGVNDFMAPVITTVRTTFLTARAAARHMIPRRSGVILAFGGYGPPTPNLGGLQVSFGAIETLRRSLACELGPHGIRVITLQTGGIPESISDSSPWKHPVTEATVSRTMLARAATLDDVGNAAVLAACDYARTITATALNISCGASWD